MTDAYPETMKDTKKEYRDAETAFAEGRYDDALEACRSIPENAEEWLDAQALTAECQVELADWAQADRTAAMVLEKDALWGTGYLIRGLAALERNQVDEAERLLARGWEIDDTIAEIAWLQSVIADFHGRFEEGDDWQTRAHTLDRDFAAPFHTDAATVDSMLLAVVDDYDDATLDTLDESRFRVAPMPSPADLREDVTLESAYRLESVDAEGDPPSISLTLYQRNLERGAKHKGELKRRIADVLDEALSVLAEAVEEAEGRSDEEEE